MVYFNHQSGLLNSALALEKCCDAADRETSSCQSANTGGVNNIKPKYGHESHWGSKGR